MLEDLIQNKVRPFVIKLTRFVTVSECVHGFKDVLKLCVFVACDVSLFESIKISHILEMVKVHFGFSGSLVGLFLFGF